MRVCHVIHSLGPGGAEGLLVDLARAAPGVGLQLGVVSLTRADDQRHVRALRGLGVEVVQLGLGSRWDPRTVTSGIRAVRSLAPDVVHTHLKTADLVGRAASARLGVPHVSTLHLIEDGVTGLARGKRWIAGQARRGADRVVAVSDAQRSWYLASFRARPEQVVTIRNGVTRPAPLPDAAIRQVRRTWGVDDGQVLAAYVAIMRPGKGHDELLDAVASLPVDSDLRVVLVGDGELRAALEQRTREDPALRDRVVFAGFREDVAELLQAVDLVVHPSLADALPTTLIQALAAGRPVLANAVGGVPEILQGTGAELLPAGDVDALATALDRLARDPVARESASRGTRERFEAEFEAHRWAARLRGLYDETVERPR